MSEFTLPAKSIKFDDGGRTVYVLDPQDNTVLKLKCTGSVKVQRCGQRIASRADIHVNGNIEIYVNKNETVACPHD